MIVLMNKTKHPEIINLSHADMCAEGGECSCTEHEHRSLVHDGKTGEVRIRVVKQSVCGSVHLFPGLWSEPLSEDVLRVKRVADLLKAGKLAKKESSPLPAPGSGEPDESTN